MTRRTPLQKVLIYAAALLLALFWFGPFVLVAVGSVIPEANLVSSPPKWFADPPSLGNYTYIFTGEIPQTLLERGATRSMISQEVRWIPYSMFNSFVVALAAMFITLVAGSLAAYSYARLRFRGRKVTFFMVLLSQLIPTVALAVPYYTIIENLGLLNTRWALIGVYAVLTMPFAVLVLTLYFKSIPKEIDEAGRIDGGSPLRVMWHITLPLALPSIVGVGLFTFMLAYGEFLIALLVTNTEDSRTLPVTLATVSTNPDVSWGLLMASIMVGIIPTLLLLFPVWRLMVKGLFAGSGR